VVQEVIKSTINRGGCEVKRAKRKKKDEICVGVKGEWITIKNECGEKKVLMPRRDHTFGEHQIGEGSRQEVWWLRGSFKENGHHPASNTFLAFWLQFVQDLRDAEDPKSTVICRRKAAVENDRGFQTRR
jgi:hypothetical protein